MGWTFEIGMPVPKLLRSLYLLYMRMSILRNNLVTYQIGSQVVPSVWDASVLLILMSQHKNKSNYKSMLGNIQFGVKLNIAATLQGRVLINSRCPKFLLLDPSRRLQISAPPML